MLSSNIVRMSTAMREKGVRLRPHMKTHKIVEIAELQLRAGACGATVATIGEAEVFAQVCHDLFIAYPLWLTRSTADRLAALAARARLSFGVDSVEAVRNTADLLDPAALSATEALIEVDSGHHRSGKANGELLDIAREMAAVGMRLGGVFTFPGHSYAPGQAGSAAAAEAAALASASHVLEEAGFPVVRRSGGSTPSALLADQQVLTEARPGVYVFGDAQQLELERARPADIALTVAATVVSRHDGPTAARRRVVLDSGSKILGSDRPAWATGYGRLLDHPAARITALSEHHATVEWPEGVLLPELGSRLRVIPNHVCLTLNLVDEVWVCDTTDPGALDCWQVAARGRNN